MSEKNGEFTPAHSSKQTENSHVAPTIIIVGAGPAGLMAAETVASAGLRTHIFDHMAAPGRKFLMAGRGGLNLTHSEPLPDFLNRYGPANTPLSDIVESFPPEALRAWAEDLGQPTFVGTSGRVFPQTLKASPLLRAWLQRLTDLGVELNLRHRWLGWDDTGHQIFARPDADNLLIRADATILALGGASWPRLGSDGTWTETLAHAGIGITPIGPFNAGVCIAWSKHLIDGFAGQPLKRIALSYAGRTVRGEAVITRTGLEGGCVYALNELIRDGLNAHHAPIVLDLDLRPDLDLQQLTERLSTSRSRQSMATFLRRKTGLTTAAVALAREPDGRLPEDPQELAAHLKKIKLEVTELSPLGRAISTSGGVAWDAIDENMMLRDRPGVFCAGEMLDWHAPTGGYLLQGVFATAVKAARGALNWLGHPHPAKIK
ncbi:hypothetical protein SAMN04488061_2984 [Filomicrobium insigne]|uniref:NAD(FAD)-utilizing dehydrogenase n=1 Tax=Filomicrobium insigne TaxID=418854 RepID=A0A1H0SQP0_9HYPH|nr:TIGR03862 family flavoprotein [Filomicrobium insigne]SDP43506.1 hypothetical protein SAMN04488061_2984 [Filomicrobium insigne]